MCKLMSCACFGPRHSTYFNYQCCASDISAVESFFNVSSFDAVFSWHSIPSPSQRGADTLRVTPKLWVDIGMIISEKWKILKHSFSSWHTYPYLIHIRYTFILQPQNLSSKQFYHLEVFFFSKLNTLQSNPPCTIALKVVHPLVVVELLVSSLGSTPCHN